jgi:hypothetical protein
MSEGSSCQNFFGGNNHYYFDMVLSKDPRLSSVFYIDAETLDCRLRGTSKSSLSQLLHMESGVFVYQSRVSVCVFHYCI